MARLIEEHPEVKQVRLNGHNHGVAIGFYEPPSNATLEQIESAVRAELAGKSDVVVEPDGDSPSASCTRLRTSRPTSFIARTQRTSHR